MGGPLHYVLHTMGSTSCEISTHIPCVIHNSACTQSMCTRECGVPGTKDICHFSEGEYREVFQSYGTVHMCTDSSLFDLSHHSIFPLCTEKKAEE